MDSYKEGLSEALDLTGAQKLALLNYNEQFKPKQPQVDKPTKEIRYQSMKESRKLWLLKMIRSANIQSLKI